MLPMLPQRSIQSVAEHGAHAHCSVARHFPCKDTGFHDELGQLQHCAADGKNHARRDGESAAERWQADDDDEEHVQDDRAGGLVVFVVQDARAKAHLLPRSK
jgi:hypothetical protein